MIEKKTDKDNEKQETPQQKRKHSLYISQQTSRWLRLQAVQEDRDMSDIVEDAIQLYKKLQ